MTPEKWRNLEQSERDVYCALVDGKHEEWEHPDFGKTSLPPDYSDPGNFWAVKERAQRTDREQYAFHLAEATESKNVSSRTLSMCKIANADSIAITWAAVKTLGGFK